jgi:hypothetical protein
LSEICRRSLGISLEVLEKLGPRLTLQQPREFAGGVAKSSLLKVKKMIPIRASVTQINLQESGRSWIEVEIDVPDQCERIELDLEELGSLAYAPPLLNSPQGLRRLWITQDGPPTINVGATISASSFRKGEWAE